jgi:hypothetical protein
MNTAQKKRLSVAANDDSAVAVVYWYYTRSLTKVWTVHRYESSRKGHKVGYEFRLRSDLVSRPDGKDGYVYVRWTKRVGGSEHRGRPASMNSRRRSSSVSSSEGGPRRRHTYPSSGKGSSEPRWEFSSPNCRKVGASMTPQKLHIHSISSSGTPLSSPSVSDFDEDPGCLLNDRELTTGRMFEIMLVTGLFVGKEEDFASKLRNDFLNASIRREDEHVSDEESIPSTPRKSRTTASTASEAEISQTPRTSIRTSIVVPQSEPEKEKEKHISFLAIRSASASNGSYASKGWGYMSNAASACVSKLMSLAA